MENPGFSEELPNEVESAGQNVYNENSDLPARESFPQGSWNRGNPLGTIRGLAVPIRVKRVYLWKN
jgi:hypothetical protein